MCPLPVVLLHAGLCLSISPNVFFYPRHTSASGRTEVCVMKSSGDKDSKLQVRPDLFWTSPAVKQAGIFFSRVFSLLYVFWRLKCPVNLINSVYWWMVEFSCCWDIGRNIIVDLWPHGVDSGMSPKIIYWFWSFLLPPPLLVPSPPPPHLRPAPINKQPLRLQLVIALATENLEETVSYFF